MFNFNSLQQRLAVFMLFPVALLLVLAGIVGFFYSRTNLLRQWQETAILELQKQAHYVDMRLHQPKQWLKTFNKSSDDTHGGNHTQEWILEQLKQVEGVDRVHIVHAASGSVQEDMRDNAGVSGIGNLRMQHGLETGMMRFHRAHIKEFTPPRYDALKKHETVSLISDLKGSAGNTIGQMEIVLNFAYLLENIEDSNLWQQHQAFLVDHNGKILFSKNGNSGNRLTKTSDSLEPEIVAAMTANSHGAIINSGYKPNKVVGYYRLQEAPWLLVTIAPSEIVLAPIQQFGWYYLFFAMVVIMCIIFLIRMVTENTVRSIRTISTAAGQILDGNYKVLPPIRTKDEVGELARSFNEMVVYLKERDRLKESLNLAMEVQQNLLPQSPPQITGLDIAAQSIYCDETGGDFFDFIEFDRNGQKTLGITVGDVSDHGIPAALLMATTRSLLRSRIHQSGRINEIINDVNLLLCQDTTKTGQFVTLFYMELDKKEKRATWIRAGHEPALLFSPSTKNTIELRGPGVALGIEGSQRYSTNKGIRLHAGQIFIIGTDGLWETTNFQGEMWGKQRLIDVVHAHMHDSAHTVLTAVISEVNRFRGSVKQDDDATLVVVKFIE